MKKNILFLAFLLASVVSFAQFPNYTNINGRYKWIAGKFDSTFTLPVGTTPSLRTGGGNAPGAMFYRTTDSTIYQYTGTQWIKLRGGVSPTDTAGIWLTNIYRKPGSDSVFYVKGGSSTFAFRDSVGNAGGGGGGGKIYYFNGGVSMGTIGGFTMYELGDTANTGAAANFTRATTGNLANFITDPGKPGLLQIPAGIWTVDAYLSETGGGANHAQIWIEVEKWDGSTITTIATSPIEEITNGSVIDLYTWSVSIPTTSLAITDRIIIQFYITNTNGKTVTLYTQNGYVGEVHTTFTTGIGSLNGLTAPSQFFATGTSGTDFNISSATATHTFNLPTASATNRGALSTTDWSTFNDKIGGSGTSTYFPKFTGSNTIGNSLMVESGFNTTTNSTFSVVRSDSTVSDSRIIIGGGNFGDAQNSVLSLLARTNGFGPATFTQGELTYSRIANQTGKLEWKDRINGSLATRFSVANGKFNINNVPNATIDTDKFMVLDGDTVEYRTGAQVLSDIGGASASSISGTTNYIPKFTSSSAIGNSQIFDNGTNVGIGTTSPTAVNANRRTQVIRGTSSELLLQSSNATDGTSLGITYTAAGNDAYFVNRLDGFYSWITGAAGNTERMRLDASGNLGLGVTPSAWASPFKSIDFSQTASLVGSNGGANLFNNAYYNGTSFLYKANGEATRYLQGSGIHYWFTAPTGTAGNAISFTQAMTLDASGRLGIGITNPSSFSILDANGQIRVSNLSVQGFYQARTSDVAGSGVFGGNSFVLRNGATSEDLNFDIFNRSTAAWYTPMIIKNSTGNVGIGTTSPTRTLHILGSTGIGTVLKLEGAAGTTTYLQLSYNGATNAQSGYIGYDASSNMPFFTNDTERMRITSGGNVGIGTTNPAQALHISTSTTYQGILINGNQAPSVGFNISNNTTPLYKIGISGNNATAFSISSGAAATDLVYITSGGNVGIGTTGPVEKLDVRGKGYFNNGGALYLDANASNTILATTGARPLLFEINSAERMRITSGGELLINTTSDAGDYKLQVNGNGYFNGDLMLKNNAVITPASGTFTVQGSTDLIMNAASGAINFRAAGSNKMVMLSSGNFGINTASPNSTFHANGSVSTAYSTKTATYTLGASDHTVMFDAVTGAANLTANLPDATTCTGRIYVIMAKMNGTYSVTLDGNGSQTIGGQTTLNLWDGCAVDATIVIQSDGSNWNIISLYAYNSSC